MTDQQQRYDVLVIGGGPAGFGAAVAAARMGCRTAIVERHEMLGGMGTAALVNNFCNAHRDHDRLIIGGIFGELRRRLVERKAIYIHVGKQRGTFEPYNPRVFASLLREMCDEAGVTTLLGRTIRDMHVPASGETTFTLDDGTTLRAKTVVDATGDAIIAQRAGVPCTFGRDGDHAVMPLTYCYKLGPIDLDEAERGMPEAVFHDETTGERFYYFSGHHEKVDQWMREERAAGRLRIERDHIAGVTSIPNEPTFATVNYGRVNIKDPTDPKQLAEAEKIGLQQVHDGIAFFRKYLPGLANVQLVELARQIGVRQSRQIVGLHTLTGSEAIACTQFDDVIAQCRYSIDIHEPNKDTTTMKSFKLGTHYDIPWRSLVPASGPGNLIVAGRCISADTEAMSSFRVSPSVMAIGEAAGVTAALASRQDRAMRDVDYRVVQQRLRDTGGVLT